MAKKCCATCGRDCSTATKVWQTNYGSNKDCVNWKKKEGKR